MSEISLKNIPQFPQLYLFLELDADGSATYVEIKAAHRRLTKAYLPDADQGKSAATERMKQINLAKTILLNPEHRAAYDQGGTQPKSEPDEANFDDWDDAESGFGRITRGDDIQAQATISSQEAYLGGPITVTAFRKSGMARITIQIPPNTKDGRILRVKGRGDEAPLAGEPGDLLVKVVIQYSPDPWPLELTCWLDPRTYKAIKSGRPVQIREARKQDGTKINPFEIPSDAAQGNWDPESLTLHLKHWYREAPWDKPRDLYIKFRPNGDLKLYLAGENISESLRNLWNSVRGKNQR